MLHVGQEVLIWGGISDLRHGQVEELPTGFERAFAKIRLRRKDGHLSEDRTLVPADRCHPLPAAVVAMMQAEREAWFRTFRPGRPMPSE